jgi:hypothetical protein
VTCSTINIDCATIGSQFDCAAECISNTPCANLLSQGMACLSATCTDGGTDGGDAGAGAACTQCLTGSCGNAAVPCFMDMTCSKWLQCAQACNQASPPTPTCFQACDAMYPSAKALYDPVYTCACSSCATQCVDSNPCAHGMDGGP